MIVGECLPASVDMLATGHYTKSSNWLHNCKIIYFDNTFIIANLRKTLVALILM